MRNLSHKSRIWSMLCKFIIVMSSVSQENENKGIFLGLRDLGNNHIQTVIAPLFSLTSISQLKDKKILKHPKNLV